MTSRSVEQIFFSIIPKTPTTMPKNTSTKTENHIDNIAENIDIVLSESDLGHLKAIYNDASKGKYLRGRSCNDVRWVYAKAFAIDPEGTKLYIVRRDSVTKIASMWRGSRIRSVQSVIDCVVQGIDDAYHYSAATKIASVWRGYRIRSVQSVIDCVVQGIDDAYHYSAATKIASVWRGYRIRSVQSVIDCVVQGIDDAYHYSAATKIASVWRGKRTRMRAVRVDDTPTPCVCDVYGGHQPKDRDRAREYLKMLHDTERFDELWEIWTQLRQNQVEDRSVIKRRQNWPTPCKEHAENVYFAAKDITNCGATFIIGQKPKHDTDVQTIVASESVPPTPVACQEPVSEEPLMHKHEGKWCEVSSATLNAKRGFDIVLNDGTNKTVSRAQLVRFPKQALPTAKEILRASGVQSLPRFYPVQQAMFNAADENRHHFYGGFQRLKRKWVWHRTGTLAS
eukprot:COSAG03_NODE_354_length_8654_cov_21.040678_8_plen_452_part_00